MEGRKHTPRHVYGPALVLADMAALAFSAPLPAQGDWAVLG